MNVIGSRPDGWWRDRPAAMRALVEELDTFAAHGDDTVTVVFDGRPFELDTHGGTGGGEGVTVLFASRRGPNAADDDIAELAERDDEPSGLSVVTSDSDLAARVRAAGASVVGAGEFRRRLDG